MKSSDKPDKPDKSDMSDQTDHLLPAHGGYRKLRSFQTAEVVYDGTVIFCDRFIEKRSRTHDQMVQAARSGRQNIAEGSMASATSKEFELKLTNVAKASLEELVLDYEDFLRQHRLPLWDKDSSEAFTVRRRYQSDYSDSYDPHGIAQAAPEVAANTLICLINQTTYLLGRQLASLEREFIKLGGFSERLYRARSEFRQKSDQATSSPTCPRCGKPMALRTARKGPNAGQSFWGCTAYPDCTGTRPADPPGMPGPTESPDRTTR